MQVRFPVRAVPQDLLLPAPVNRDRKLIDEQDIKLPDGNGPGNGPFPAIRMDRAGGQCRHGASNAPGARESTLPRTPECRRAAPGSGALPENAYLKEMHGIPADHAMTTDAIGTRDTEPVRMGSAGNHPAETLSMRKETR